MEHHPWPHQNLPVVAHSPSRLESIEHQPHPQIKRHGQMLKLQTSIEDRLIHLHVSKFITKHSLPRSSTQEGLLTVTNIWHSMHSQIAVRNSVHSLGVQGLTSRSQQVASGVPQGGPLMFNIFHFKTLAFRRLPPNADVQR